MRAAAPMLRRAVAVLVLSLVPVACVGGAASAAASGASGSSAPLKSPKTTPAQDRTYFSELGEADPALVTYEQQYETVALRALLTDGTAFCALLKRGGGIDKALVSEADGVRGTESQTHLPLSVTTFNTIESVALLTLCPGELRLVPKAVRSKITRLGKALAAPSG